MLKQSCIEAQMYKMCTDGCPAGAALQPPWWADCHVGAAPTKLRPATLLPSLLLWLW